MVQDASKTQLKNPGKALAPCSSLRASEVFFFFVSLFAQTLVSSSRSFSDSNEGNRHQLSVKFSFTFWFCLQNGNDTRWDGAGEEIVDLSLSLFFFFF